MGEISSVGPDGKESIQSAMQELKEHGYAVLENEIGEDGKLVGKFWHIHESPVEGKTPQRGKPAKVKPAASNTHTESNTDRKVTQTCEFDLKEDQEPEKKTKAKESAQAEEIYQAYPRKVGKPKALAAIKKALKEIEAAELLAIVEAYTEAIDGTEARFIPHPARWFNEQRYGDDPSEWNKGQKFEPIRNDPPLNYATESKPRPTKTPEEKRAIQEMVRNMRFNGETMATNGNEVRA